MDNNSLKSTIIEEIGSIENEETLSFIQDIIQNITGEGGKSMPSHIKSNIEKSISEIESGKYLSEEKADSMVDEWFKD
jgi:hypothetical protein